MVAPIASALAPVVVQSATDSDGLVNQAFKITVLIGLALSITVGVFLIYQLTDILGEAAETVGGVGDLLRFGFNVTPLGLTITAIATGLNPTRFLARTIRPLAPN